MNFDTYNENQFTPEQICAAVYHSDVASLATKEALASFKDTVYDKSILTPDIALYHYAQIARSISAKILHPVDRLSAVAATKDINVSTTTIQYEQEGSVQILSPVRGYFVDNDSARMASKAALADSLAYQYTAASANSRDAILTNNFSQNRAAFAIPVTAVTAPMSTTWKTNDALGNSRATLANITKPAAMVVAAKMVVQSYKGLKPSPTMAVSVSQQITTQSHAEMPATFAPPLKSAQTLQKAYKALACHRQARGEDNRWLSPLTSGYYLGSVSKSIDKVMWNVMDILHVVRTYELGCIVFASTKTNNCIAMSLAASGYPVFVRVNDYNETLIRQKDDRVLPGVYRIHYSTVLTYNLMLVVEPMAVKRVVESGGKLITDPACFSTYDRIKQNKEGYYMTWVQLTEDFDERKMVTFPSTHCHAGHVIAVHAPSATIDVKTYPLEYHVGRFALSNVFKTWFPLTRLRFIEFDIKYYGFHNLGVSKTFKIRLRDIPPVASVEEYMVDLDTSKIDFKFDTSMDVVRNAIFDTLKLPVVYSTAPDPPPPMLTKALPPPAPPVTTPVTSTTTSAPKEEDEEEEEVELTDVKTWA